jgi:hypothetical protein
VGARPSCQSRLINQQAHPTKGRVFSMVKRDLLHATVCRPRGVTLPAPLQLRRELSTAHLLSHLLWHRLKTKRNRALPPPRIRLLHQEAGRILTMPHTALLHRRDCHRPRLYLPFQETSSPRRATPLRSQCRAWQVATAMAVADHPRAKTSVWVEALESPAPAAGCVD